MGESELGERANGSRYFVMDYAPFTSIKDAEIFGFSNIKTVRWLVGEKVVKPGQNPIYNFVSKPVTPRRG